MPNDTAVLARSSSPQIGDLPKRMAKADLRKPEIVDWRPEIGRAIERCRQTVGLSLKEFAALIEREPRQVARWIEGTERPQFDALFAVEALRAPLVIALAALAKDIDITTTISIRRSA